MATPATLVAEGQQKSRHVIRISCRRCRGSKLKCDRATPRCTRCVKADEECDYPGSRKTHVGKRAQVRDLEAKLGQLEDKIKNIGPVNQSNQLADFGSASIFNFDPLTLSSFDSLPLHTSLGSGQPTASQTIEQSQTELTRLGQFEQLPALETIEELTSIYFNELHHVAPMLHRDRYIAALHLPPHMRPPMCLQYIVMASAAKISSVYRQLALPFYQRARAYAESDEMKEEGEHFTTVAHAQFWLLTANFEARQTMFLRASASVARGIRIAQMLNLHQMDRKTPIGRPTLAPARDWTELEERRRTWWVVFCLDRFLCGATGWPALVNDRDMDTLLPASEEAFANGFEEKTITLKDLLHQRSEKYSSFAGRVLAAHLFHQTIEHTSLPASDGNPEDFKNGSYWKQHRDIDNNLASLLIALPDTLRLPRSIRSPNAVFVNLITQAAIISLHRAAQWVMHPLQDALPEHTIRQSHSRLIPAAEEILHVLRMIPDLEATLQNTMLMYTAYMAALVFLEDFAAEHSQQSEDNMDFLVGILITMGRSNRMVASLANQLAIDMYHLGIKSAVADKASEFSAPQVAEKMADSAGVRFCVLKKPPDAEAASVVAGMTPDLGASQSALFGERGGKTVEPSQESQLGESDELWSNTMPQSPSIGPKFMYEAMAWPGLECWDSHST